MLAAVEFDDELFLQANEIHNIGADGLLAAEFESMEMPAAVFSGQALCAAAGVRQGRDRTQASRVWKRRLTGRRFFVALSWATANPSALG
jgi:hypothetical protein